jgi:hypothetical protein
MHGFLSVRFLLNPKALLLQAVAGNGSYDMRSRCLSEWLCVETCKKVQPMQWLLAALSVKVSEIFSSSCPKRDSDDQNP